MIAAICLMSSCLAQVVHWFTGELEVMKQVGRSLEVKWRKTYGECG